MSAIITIKFAVPVGHQLGDFARLHGNGGEGDIDWVNPLNNKIYQLFPDGAGIFGWGHAPWGHHFWGHAFSMLTAGWGHLPWGRSPWGHGTAIITATHQVESCGTYKFGFACYDKLGNPHEGVPQEIEVVVHTAPPAPDGLKKNSYDKDTDILILDVAA
jgi:hypothetical protein